MRHFRNLEATTDRAAVFALLTAAQDYYHLWLGRAPAAAEVDEVFTDAPPGCDPAQSRRLGLWIGPDLCGVAELSFGFPTAQDAYLGLMILHPKARGMGHGAAFLAHAEALARARGCTHLSLAVLQANPRGRAFWSRMGFADTGLSRSHTEGTIPHTSHRLVKSLTP